MSTSLPHYKQTTRRWLSLLFVAGFLLNIQSSYACVMMPDMEQNQMECCCGASHRMDDMADMEHSSSAMLMHHDMTVDTEMNSHDKGPICNDPQMACCEVEVSVGINDPPDDEAIGVASLTKTSPHKQVKQLDSHIAVAVYDTLDFAHELLKFETVARPPDPNLLHAGPALYLTTQRYRV